MPPPNELREEEDLEEDELDRPKPPELLVVPVRFAKERCDCFGLETIFARAACLLAFGDLALDLIDGVFEGMAGDMLR